MALPAALAALADRMGIAASYVPAGEREPVAIEDETRVAVLAAMGVESSSEAAARAALARLEEQDRARLLPPVWLAAAGASQLRVPVRVPERGAPRVEAEWIGEDGERREDAVRIEGVPGESGHAEIRVPVLPAGYHALVVRGTDGSESRTALLAAPERCHGVSDALGPARAFGIWANLYALRSERGIGVGDLGALRELVRFTGRCGGDFVGLSPLHALGIEAGMRSERRRRAECLRLSCT